MRPTLAVIVSLVLGPALAGQQFPLLHEQPSGAVDYYLGAVDLGDVTGDGVPDLALGHEQVAVLNHLYAWRLVSGADGSIVRWIVSASATFSSISGLAGIPDLTGDGHAEVAYTLTTSTAFPATGLSVFFVQDGATGNTLWSQQIGPTGLTSGGTRQVEVIDDLDGDGLRDLVLLYRGGSSQLGNVATRIIWMSSHNGAILHELLDHADIVGAIAAVGDTNGDGLPETLVGAWDSPYVAPEAGGASLISGSDFSYLRFWNGNAANDHFGSGVKGVGDVDGDGHADVLIVAAAEEKVRIYSGDDNAVLASFDLGTGGAYQSRLLSVRPFDWNGDGVDDHLFRVLEGNAPTLTQVRSGLDFSLLADAEWLPIADVNGDGIADRVEFVSGVGPPPAYTPLVTEARVVAHKGAQVYGAGSGGLALHWEPSASGPAFGFFTLSGGTPGAPVLIGGSVAPASGLIFGTPFPLLIDAGPASLFLQVNATLGPLGELRAPVSLSQPALAGVVVYYQWAELGLTPGTSNGLQLLFDS